MQKTILIIGTGFIGARLANTLNSKGYNVIALDTFVSTERSSLNSGITIITGNAKNKNVVKTTFSRYTPDYVFLSANSSMGVDGVFDFLLERETLETIALNVVRYCLEYRPSNLFFFSSQDVYPVSNRFKLIDENSKTCPSTLSGETFLSVENFLRVSLENKVDVSLFRFSSIFGPRKSPLPKEDPTSLILESVKNSEPFALCDPNSKVDILYVDDAVAAIVKVFEHIRFNTGVKIPIINIGSGKPVKVKDIYLTVAKHFNSTKVKPVALRVNSTHSKILDVTLLKSFGWALSTNLDSFLGLLDGR
jgi:nucleoside-diphosphate-sugar epimerase